MTTAKQLVLPLLLAVLLIPMQGCELLFEVGELEIAGEVGEAAAAVGEFSGSSAALRAAAMEDIAIGRGGLRAGLGAAVEETAAGRFTTITSEGEIVARGRAWGRVAPDGDIFLRPSTGAAEARVGKVANGFVWAPDEGGNLLPTARIRGSLRSASYKLRSSRAGSLNGMTLSRDVDIDVLRVDKGWYEVRAAGTKITGWVDGSLLSVALSAAAGFDRVAGAVLTCVQHDSLTGVGRSIPRTRTASGNSREDSDGSVPILHIVLRYPPSSRERADSVARTLRSQGRQIVRQEVDVPATETCGGEIYYNRDDFRSARSIQALLQPIAVLRISSFEVDDARLLIWLR